MNARWQIDPYVWTCPYCTRTRRVHPSVIDPDERAALLRRFRERHICAVKL